MLVDSTGLVRLTLVHHVANDLAHIANKEKTRLDNAADTHDDPDQNWGTIHHVRANFKISLPQILPIPDIHLHVFTACLWGADYAKLVLPLFSDPCVGLTRMGHVMRPINLV